MKFRHRLRLLPDVGDQIKFVADEHDNNVGVSVVSQFLQPPFNVFKGGVPGDVVDKQCTNSTTVVCVGDGSVPRDHKENNAVECTDNEEHWPIIT